MKSRIFNCDHGIGYYRLRPKNWLFTPIRDILFKFGWVKTPYLFDITYVVGGYLKRAKMRSDTLADWCLTGFEVHNPHRGLVVEEIGKEVKGEN